MHIYIQYVIPILKIRIVYIDGPKKIYQKSELYTTGKKIFFI